MAYTSDLSLKITAIDIHGNTTEEIIGLVYQDSSIPSFSVESGNSQVTLAWEDVPLASSYNVYYTLDGSSPVTGLGSYPAGGTYKSSSLSSGAIISGLDNGKKHIFILEAVISGYTSSYSEEIPSVPLSPLSYCPRITQETEGEVLLEWPEYGGDTGYSVWRSLDEGTTWQKISGDLSTTQFTDTGVTSGDLAWYKILPNRYSSVESWHRAVKVHSLAPETEYSSASLLQSLKRGMFAWEITGTTNPGTYLAAVTAGSGGSSPSLELIDVTSASALYELDTYAFDTETDEGSYSKGLSAADNLIFNLKDDGSDAAGDFIYIYDMTTPSAVTQYSISNLNVAYDVNTGNRYQGDSCLVRR